MKAIEKTTEGLELLSQVWALYNYDGLTQDQIADRVGRSRQTICGYLKSYRGLLGTLDLGGKDQRRAMMAEEIDAAKRAAWKIIRDGETDKDKSGGLRTLAILMGHERAIYGLDMPKEVEQKKDINIKVRWSSEPLTPVDVIDGTATRLLPAENEAGDEDSWQDP